MMPLYSYDKIILREEGTYWYLNPENYEIDDIVYVDGSKIGCLGKITEISNMWDHWAGSKIKEKVGHVGPFYIEKIEKIWSSYKPKERKIYLQSININETVTKKQFFNIVEHMWNEFSLKENDWVKFLETLNK